VILCQGTLVVTLANFANGTHQVECDSAFLGGAFATSSTTSSTASCSFSGTRQVVQGSTLWAVVDGVQSNFVTAQP
jgi:hypothetical protein